jgi:hypothetical protein
MTDIKECVSGKVRFQYYRDNELWYECDNGFRFPVPINDTAGAVFLNEDKGILFMRWIRKWAEELNYDQA